MDKPQKKSYSHNSRLSQPLVHETYFSLLDSNARESPTKDAFVFYDSQQERTSFTFNDLSSKSFALAAILLEQYQVQPRDRIALVASNSPLFLITELAILRVGATVVFPPAGISGGDDLINALLLTNCQGIICDMTYVEPSTISFLHKCIPDLKFAVSFGESVESESIEVGSFVNMTSRSADDSDRAESLLIRQNQVNPDAPAVVFVISGSTGDPKAVAFSHFSLVNNILVGLKDILDVKSSDCFFVNHPFNHYGCQLYGVGFTCCIGTTTVTTETRESVANANTVMVCHILEVEQCTMGLLFGILLHDLVNFPDLRKRADLSNLRLAVTSGQPLHADQAEALRVMLPHLRLCNVYGSTELCPTVASPANEYPPMGFIGKVFPGTEAKVVDENGVVLPVNTLGELYIRGPYVSMGCMTENQIQPMTDNFGWAHSGDFAVMDTKGFIKIEGRKRNMIKRAAFKIIPAQVERILLQNKKVRDVEVIGVPDARLHEEICACVVKNDPSLTEEDLLEWCAQVFKPDTTSLSLAPRYIFFISSDFPRNTSGEVDYEKLKTLAINNIKSQK